MGTNATISRLAHYVEGPMSNSASARTIKDPESAHRALLRRSNTVGGFGLRGERRPERPVVRGDGSDVEENT
jgi:hypothetical protein